MDSAERKEMVAHLAAVNRELERLTLGETYRTNDDPDVRKLLAEKATAEAALSIKP